MKLVAGADEAGIALREEFRGYLQRLVHEVIDVGTYNAPRNSMLETEIRFQPTRMR